MPPPPPCLWPSSFAYSRVLRFLRPRWRRVGHEIYRPVGGYVTGNLLISLIAGGRITPNEAIGRSRISAWPSVTAATIAAAALAGAPAELQSDYLPRIANLDDWWCQGFSEPGSGSDAFGLAARAVRRDDRWILNGRKAWITNGAEAGIYVVFANTDPAVALASFAKRLGN